MRSEADALAARRRLSRRLSWWRFVAVFAVLTALVTVVVTAAGTVSFARLGSHIARVEVSGIILEDEERQALLSDLAETSQVKGVILHIDSPGGTTVGAEALFDAVREIVSSGKPVVAVMGTVAASGGYLVATAADHIVARGNTTTGSIGVVFQWAQVNELLDSLGVKVRSVKSVPLKAEPSPFDPTTPRALEVTQEMVDEAHNWFVGLVAERRPFDMAEARRLADGRVYSGRQAVEAGLIDALGDEEQAREWLETEGGLSEGLEVVDWRVRREEDLGLIGISLAWLARTTGLTGVADMITLAQKTLRTERLRLDGLVSVWQAPD